MMTRNLLPSFFVFGALGLSGLSARVAHADTACSSDADCGKGFSCTVVGGSACGSPGCEGGKACPPPTPCEPTEIKACEPGACKVDTDCADGMVCYTSSAPCAEPACAPGSDCPPSTCASGTQSQCIPRYQAPCSTAADCGAGFNCVQGPTPDCSVRSGPALPAPAQDGGTPNGGAGATPDADAAGCSAGPSGPSYCAVIPVTCESAGDCLNGWACAASPSGATCATSPAPNGTAGVGGAATAGCTTAPPVMQCTPPYYSSGVGLGVGAPTRGGDVTGEASSGATSGSAAAAAPTNSGNPTSSSAGCSVAGDIGNRSSALGLAIFGLLGLIGVRRRAQLAPRAVDKADCKS